MKVNKSLKKQKLTKAGFSGEHNGTAGEKGKLPFAMLLFNTLVQDLETLFSFQSSFLLTLTLRSIRNGSYTWVSAIQMENLDGDHGSRCQTGQTPAILGIWGVNLQWGKSLYTSVFQVNRSM